MRFRNFHGIRGWTNLKKNKNSIFKTERLKIKQSIWEKKLNFVVKKKEENFN